MNTSAPICIQSYIKSGAGRPQTKSASRRQASFANSNSSNANQGTRRNTTISQKGPSQQNTVGVVSGQTLNLNGTTQEGINANSIGYSSQTHKGTMLHVSNSATPGGFEAIDPNSSLGGLAASSKVSQPVRLGSGYKT